MIVLLKTPPKYRKLDYNQNKKAQKITHTLAIFVDHGIMAHIPWWLSQWILSNRIIQWSSFKECHIHKLYMSGFLKTVLMSKQPQWHFSKKTHRISPSINHRQPVNTQSTRPPCLCLAGSFPAAKPAGHDWPRPSCKENQQFHWAKNLSLWNLPTPQEIKPNAPPRPPWYQRVARHLGCRAPNLLYGYPLAFKHRKDLAGDKKCPKFDTVFENRGIYWPAKKEKSLQLAPTTPKWSQILRFFFFFFSF